jgi:hypothetical protein
MRHFIEALGRPEYVHVLLNAFPGYILPVGLMILFISLIRENRAVQVTGLWLVLLVGLSGWPTWYYGHEAFHHLSASLDEQARAWANAHEERAERSVYALYALGALALAALVVPRKAHKSAKPLAWAVLVIGLGCTGLVFWTAEAGGQIRHPEFRTGPPPAVEDKHEH